MRIVVNEVSWVDSNNLNSHTFASSNTHGQVFLDLKRCHVIGHIDSFSQDTAFIIDCQKQFTKCDTVFHRIHETAWIFRLDW